jgi:hypothetical protein
VSTDGEPAVPQQRRRISFRVWAYLLTSAVVLLIAGSVAVKIVDFSPRLPNIPGPTTNDLSASALVLSIQKVGRYVGAVGTFQQVVELDTKVSWLPTFLYERHTTFFAVGTVNAYVDFAKIDEDSVKVDRDRKSVTITLPRPVLEKPNLDNDKSHIVGDNRGLIQWAQDVFANDPNRQQQFYQLGEDKIRHAALESDLRIQADDSIRTKLTQLAQLLGFISVTINFTESESPSPSP